PLSLHDALPISRDGVPARVPDQHFVRRGERRAHLSGERIARALDERRGRSHGGGRGERHRAAGETGRVGAERVRAGRGAERPGDDRRDAIGARGDGRRRIHRAVAVPPRAPPPEAIAAVTVTPDWLTALPAPSRTCTTGCWANATPLCAVPDGCVVNVSSVAVPAPSVIGPEVTGGSPVAAKLSV